MCWSSKPDPWDSWHRCAPRWGSWRPRKQSEALLYHLETLETPCFLGQFARSKAQQHSFGNHWTETVNLIISMKPTHKPWAWSGQFWYAGCWQLWGTPSYLNSLRDHDSVFPTVAVLLQIHLYRFWAIWLNNVYSLETMETLTVWDLWILVRGCNNVATCANQ